MTKQEKIKEAYGEHWESTKDFVDENGRLKVLWGSIFHYPQYENLASSIQNMIDVSNVEFEGDYYAKPKSLQGIEDNNGWTKIESENDLPKKEIDCFFMKGKKMFTGVWDNELKRFYSGNNWISNVFHYQEIKRPEQPLY